VQLADGRTSRIVDLTLKGETVSDHTVKIGKLPSPAKKVLVNYNYDVLSN
jgi:hypothetical protein